MSGWGFCMGSTQGVDRSVKSNASPHSGTAQACSSIDDEIVGLPNRSGSPWVNTRLQGPDGPRAQSRDIGRRNSSPACDLFSAILTGH